MKLGKKKRPIDILKEKDKKLYDNIKLVMENLPDRESGFSQNDVAKVLGLPPATARSVIREARRYGMPICSSFQGGYWITHDIKELKEQVKFFDTQAFGLTKTALALDDTLRRFKKGDYKTI